MGGGGGSGSTADITGAQRSVSSAGEAFSKKRSMRRVVRRTSSGVNSSRSPFTATMREMATKMQTENKKRAAIESRKKALERRNTDSNSGNNNGRKVATMMKRNGSSSRNKSG